MLEGGAPTFALRVTSPSPSPWTSLDKERGSELCSLWGQVMTTILRGVALLRDPHLNKSTAFTEAEREALGLVGLVPEGIDTEEVQIQRALQQLAYKPTD